MPGPVFAMPPPPQDWEEASLSLVRIIDPLGDAIAWFAPEAGGACAGYAVRRQDGSGGPGWRWIMTGSRSKPAAVVRDAAGGTIATRWRLVSRDPASCTLGWNPPRSPDEYWRLTASLQDARLSLTVNVRNTGATPIHAGIHVHLTLASPPEVTDHTSISLVADAAPDTSTVRTVSIGDRVVCTAVDHPVSGDAPVIHPGEFRQFTVVIGPGREG